MSQIWDHGRLEMMLDFGELGLRVVVVIVRQASGCGPFHDAAALSRYLSEIILCTNPATTEITHTHTAKPARPKEGG